MLTGCTPGLGPGGSWFESSRTEKKTCRLMVRYATHDGYDVGSNPAGYI